MRRIALTLPTNRPCSPALTALGHEAAYAADHFGVHVELLVLDSSDGSSAGPVHADHARTLRALPDRPRVTVRHLDEERQRAFLAAVSEASGATGAGSLLALLLPARLSYGACTNRAFLIAAALGCESVHRRDSDSRYQQDPAGRTVFPVHHELAALGRPASAVGESVSKTVLAEELAERPVALVGGSFIGEPSVDIEEIDRLDPEVYHEVVSLWAPMDWSAGRKRALVEESFRGAGKSPFVADDSTLTLVDPMRVDMCNVAFHGVHEQVPLPPATETIGSDYFLLHLVRHTGLPGVLHNRDIVNFHTPERRTDRGFAAYQLRFVKFLLSMLYLNHLYDRLAEEGPSLTDGAGRLRAPAVADLVRRSTALDRSENRERLARVDAAYRRLGGRYAEFADSLLPRRSVLLDEARTDMAEFAELIAHWGALIHAAPGCAALLDRPVAEDRTGQADG
ncbi:DUF6271 family protein [Streptomyces tardus]|uniref:DUF6271 family protein n=1 Tax=Streptomyces tardus TaxID=2780544 RepID=UPI0027E4B586|nr:DUF6271 family protein [Streptomyces tardus]